MNDSPFHIALPIFPTHQLMDIWVVSIFWLLWIMGLWICVYRFFWGHIFSVLLAVELLGHLVTLCNLLKSCPTLISKVAFHWQPTNLSICSAILAIICLFYYNHLSGCEVWYLIVGFFGLFCAGNGTEGLLHARQTYYHWATLPALHFDFYFSHN